MPPLSQSLSGSLHNVSEGLSSNTTSPTPSDASCSSSQPDLSYSSMAMSPDCSSSSSCCSSSSPPCSKPVYNKQVADSCIVRVSVECGNNGNVYKSILVSEL